MINKLYKNDTIENLKIFSDLKIQKEYSNKSKELNSKFNDFTYSRFYENLKNYNKKIKSININSFVSISSDPNKSKKKVYKEFDISKIKASIEKMKKKENILKEKRLHPFTERCLYSNPIYTLLKDKLKRVTTEKMKLLKKDRDNKPNTPEIGRYNPIYESINKHIQQVVFSLKNFNEYNNELLEKTKTKINEKIIENEKNKFVLRKKNRKISSCNLKKDNNFTIEKKDKKKNKSKLNNNIFYNTAVIKKNIKRIEGRNVDKNNHCLRFESYTSRRPLMNKIFYKTENNIEISSLFLQKNFKGSVRFNKVSSNKNSTDYFEKLINEKKDIPSLGFYRPNYSLVTNKTMNIFFNGKRNQKKNLKITKLKKILGRYNIRDEYQLFNLLNHKNETSKDNFYE